MQKANSILVKSLSKDAGFNYCGIARAQPLNDDAKRLENWLQSGKQGSMKYMENYFDLRIDPTKLVPGAKSVITLLKNYFPGHLPQQEIKISKYALGADYHTIIKNQLKQLLHQLQNKVGNINGRGFIDSAPVMERAWAQKSGLGWVGKNGNLINKQNGSFFFIATLITDLELEYDDPFAKDYCGNCTKCIDACPTEAILPERVVDGSKCISYFTIELKEEIIPESMSGKFQNWMFGCDVCQDVCPWNRFSTIHNEAAFTPLPEILNFTTKDWEELTEEAFKKIFSNSPLKRSKFSGIKRNLKFIQTTKIDNLV